MFPGWWHMVERLGVSSRHDEILGRVERQTSRKRPAGAQIVWTRCDVHSEVEANSVTAGSEEGCTLSSPTDTVQHEKYSDLVTKLADFEQRFQDFRKHIGTMKLISGLLIRFQLIPRALLINTSSNSLTFRTTVTWKYFSLSMICWTFTATMCHQVVKLLIRPATSLKLLHLALRSKRLDTLV